MTGSVMARIAFGILLFLLVLAGWVYSATLIPDPNSQDPEKRYGFESFEPFVRNVFLMEICFGAAFFMTGLQRLYPSSDEPSILSFVSSDPVS